jgi:pimeloyl-ACP methyl ester carboxylesterase
MTNYKRIVLVGHSLGGAISLDVYRLLFGMDTVTAKKVHAIFLAGTPSRGADLASYADRVSNALSFVGIRVDRSSIDAVKQYAPFVDEMLGNEAWRLEGAPVVYCSYELKGIPRFGTVVGKDKISSICQAQRTQGIGADHFGLVKPKNREVDSYVWLRDALTNLDAERNRLYANGIDRDPRAEALARLRTAKALIAHLEQFLSARQGPITQAERGQIQKDIGVLHAVVKSLEP